MATPRELSTKLTPSLACLDNRFGVADFKYELGSRKGAKGGRKIKVILVFHTLVHQRHKFSYTILL
jgi:hypothetical protein